MPTKTSKTDKLKASEFFDEIRSVAFGINYFAEEVNNESLSYEMRETSRDLLGKRLAEWAVAKSAIKYITGKTYAFTRTDEYYGIVNEDDESDWLYQKERDSQTQLSYTKHSDANPYSACDKKTERAVNSLKQSLSN